MYAVVGVLAVGAVMGTGGRTTDPRGALESIGTQPFGRFLLGLVAVGLTGYALWRLVQAIADPEGEGHDMKGIVRRIGHGGAGLIYAGLAFTAGQLALASGSGGSSP